MSEKPLTFESARDTLKRAAHEVAPLQPIPMGRISGFPMVSFEVSTTIDNGQLSLFSSTPAPLPLKAYLASALTGLNDNERAVLFGVSDLIRETARSFDVSLYEPRMHTDPKVHAEVTADFVYERDKEQVLSSDLLIHLCHHPSTGAGEELEFARSALLPILLIYPHDISVSKMILGIPSLIIKLSYKSIEDLQSQLADTFATVRPVLEARKLAFSRHQVNVIGEKIRELRQRIGLTRKQLATASKGQMSAERLASIEEKNDLESNPSLMELREIATMLKTTVSEIVEPNLVLQIFQQLKHWTEGREAARTFISDADRRRIIRALLIRMADSL